MDFSPGRAYGIRLKNKLFSDSPGADLHGWSIATVKRLLGKRMMRLTRKSCEEAFGRVKSPGKELGPCLGLSMKSYVVIQLKSKRPHQSGKASAPTSPETFRSEVEKALSAAALRLQTSAAKKRRQSARLRQHADSGTDSSNNSDSIVGKYFFVHHDGRE